MASGARGSAASRAPGPASGPTVAGKDVVVVGLETREDRITCTQPSKVHTLGLAMVVTYSFRSGEFTAWKSEYINDLVRTLMSAGLVVGYNPHGFEYKVLGPFTGRNLSRVPTVDLLLEVTKSIGKRLSFDLVTGPTLDRTWTADRSQASVSFKQGDVPAVADLCTEGTRLVRDLFLHMVGHSEIRYQTGPEAEVHSAVVDLQSKLSPDLAQLVRQHL